MKYMVFDLEHSDLKWSNVYCNLDGKETPEDIAQAILIETYVCAFKKEHHTNAGCPKILNDENLFILRDSYGANNIWQIGNQAKDIAGTWIPHLYNVCKIGVMFD